MITIARIIRQAISPLAQILEQCLATERVRRSHQQHDHQQHEDQVGDDQPARCGGVLEHRQQVQRIAGLAGVQVVREPVEATHQRRKHDQRNHREQRLHAQGDGGGWLQRGLQQQLQQAGQQCHQHQQAGGTQDRPRMRATQDEGFADPAVWRAKAYFSNTHVMVLKARRDALRSYTNLL
jgi:hypothetical protein